MIDCELNSLNYVNALLNDKRKFCQYYISLLKTKHPIIFSFFPFKDYNTMIIKICLFSLSFSIYYTLNFAFFNYEVIHKIYKEEGKYDIIYFLPKILIALAASHIIIIILKYIFLSERNIIQVKKQTSFNKALSISDNVKKNIVIKYIIFFILGTIILGFFGCYCPHLVQYIKILKLSCLKIL